MPSNRSTPTRKDTSASGYINPYEVAYLCDIHLIASKAVIEKEVSEGVVKVRTQPDQTVSLVGVGQLPAGDHNDVQNELFLPEENIGLLHRPGKHHGLLVVHVVVGRSVHHQVLLV